MRSTIYIIALLSLLCVASFAQIEEWQWVLPAGGSSDDYSLSIVADDLGNSYVTGNFADTLYIGSSVLISNGDEDIFVAKAGPDGNWLWAKSGGSSGSESARAITLDPNGNVFVTGIFYTPVTFGDFTLTSNGEHDFFVLKLDNSGNWVWALSGGGIYSDEANGIASDQGGNLYLVGSFLDTVAFGATSLTSHGGCDIFAAKIDPAGNWVWAAHAGSIEEEPGIPWLPVGDFGTGIALDGQGNIYVAGNFIGTANFGSLGITSTGEHDVCVAKLDPNGNWLWARQGGGLYPDWAQSIVVDPGGDIFVGGSYRVSADFGGYVINAFSNTHPEVFIASISSEGTWLWARRAGGNYIISLGGMALDDYGSLFVSGSFFGNASFGNINLSSWGLGDIFLSKISLSGDWQHVMQAGGTQNDQGLDVCIDHSNIFLAGSFSGDAQFGDLFLTSAGMRDVFLARIQGYTSIWDDTQAPSAHMVLGQNFPNPFNPSTTISLNISAGDRYKLDIHDLRGRRVATLFEGFLAPGRHDLVWNGSSDNNEPLPSGIYFYRLSGPGQSITKKMLLCK
ncbi:MAG: SBBP repeat-containing protein [Candidatus Syntrophosphaera sp.]|nr:SBBP repeat-containing protein [Candidatus Syntrophosphaera sp.]